MGTHRIRTRSVARARDRFARPDPQGFPSAWLWIQNPQIKVQSTGGPLLSYLLDTNIISQSVKRLPSAALDAWLEAHDARLMYLSVISLAEFRQGLGRMPVGKKKLAIAHWLEATILPHFQDRILPVTAEIAASCGDMLATGRISGSSPDPFDTLIAATARVHGFSVVTLNRKHFASLNVPLVNL